MLFKLKKCLFLSKIILIKGFRLFFAVLLSPQKCVMCGKSTYLFPVCSICIDNLKKETTVGLSFKRCSVCGKPLISELVQCTSCSGTESTISNKEQINLFSCFTSVYPIFLYLLEKKKLLFAWKTLGNRMISILCSEFVHDVLQIKYPNIIVVPIPPRPKKIREYGWDQVNDLVVALKYIYGVQIINLLSRTGVQQQKKLNRAERLEQQGSNYELSTLGKKLLQQNKLPKEVIIIDDVITTGVTMRTCCDILKSAGVEKIHALSLFMVP